MGSIDSKNGIRNVPVSGMLLLSSAATY